MSLLRSFEACTLTPSLKSKHGMPPSIKTGPGGKFTTTSFFIDSSGHSNFILPLELKFASQEDLDVILAANSIAPAPANLVSKEENDAEAPAQDKGEDPPESSEPTADSATNVPKELSFIGFEARTSSVDGSSKTAVVEAISILSTSVQGLVVSFETEVTIRASALDSRRTASKEIISKDAAESPSSVLTKIEITPMLTIKNYDKSSSRSTVSNVPDLLALELGAIPDHMQKESSARAVQEARLDAISLDVTLAHAFTISVNSLPGQTLGTTMVSLTIQHSNLHREPVTINNIAFHPGHSRYETVVQSERNKYGSKYAVSKYKNDFSYSMNSQVVHFMILLFSTSQYDESRAMGICTTDRTTTALDFESLRCIFYSSNHERRGGNA